jgi:hypothetical protein
MLVDLYLSSSFVLEKQFCIWSINSGKWKSGISNFYRFLNNDRDEADGSLKGGTTIGDIKHFHVIISKCMFHTNFVIILTKSDFLGCMKDENSKMRYIGLRHEVT